MGVDNLPSELSEILKGRGLVIGRDRHCDVVIYDRSVERQHLLLRYYHDEFWVSMHPDADTEEPVLVNGKAIEKVALEDGDFIEIGDVELAFYSIPDFFLDIQNARLRMNVGNIEAEQSNRGLWWIFVLSFLFLIAGMVFWKWPLIHKHLTQFKVEEVRDGMQRARLWVSMLVRDSDDLTQEIQVGMDLLRRGRLDDAKLIFQNILEEHPQRPEGYYYYGIILEKEKKWRESLSFFSRCKELDHTYFPVLDKLAWLYFLAGDMAKAQTIVEEEAEARAEKNRATMGGGREPLRGSSLGLLRSFLLAKAGQESEALLHAKQMVRFNPTDPDRLLYLAALQLKYSDINEAITTLRHGLSMQSNEPRYIYTLVRLLLRAGQFREALHIMEKYAADHANDLVAQTFLAGLLLQEGRFSLAENVLRRMRTQGRDAVHRSLLLAHIKMGQVIRARVAGERNIEQKIADMEQFFLRTIQGHKDNLLLPLALSSFYYNIDRLKAAEETLGNLFTRVQKRRQDALTHLLVGDLYRLRGLIALKKENLGVAIREFRDVLNLYPETGHSLRQLVQAYVANGSIASALSVLMSSLERGRGDIQAYFLSGELYLLKKREREALQAFERAARRFPQEVLFLEAVVRLRIARNHHKDAEKLINEILALPENQGRVLGNYLKGIYFQVLGKYQRSVAFFERALKHDLYFHDALRARALSMIRLRQQRTALRDLEKVLEQYPFYVEAHFYKGQLLMRSGQMYKAENALRRAVQLRPEWPAVHHSLGWLYLKINRLQDAVEAFRRSQEEIASLDHLLLLLSASYQQSGDQTKAASVLATLIETNPSLERAINQLALINQVERQAYRSPYDVVSPILTAAPLSRTRHPVSSVGWFYYQQNRMNAMLPLFLFANTKAGHVPKRAYHVGLVDYHKKILFSLVSEKSMLSTMHAEGLPLMGIEESKMLFNKLKYSSEK
ncbi:tetratricopeptide repeat protein [Magnetococcales bacterium HHB-1]